MKVKVTTRIDDELRGAHSTNIITRDGFAAMAETMRNRLDIFAEEMAKMRNIHIPLTFKLSFTIEIAP